MHDRSCSGRLGCSHLPADPSLGPRPFRLPGDPERFGRPRPHDLRHLKLTLALQIERKAIAARAEITVTQRDPEAHTLTLDAIGFEVQGIERVDGAVRALPYRYDGESLAIELGLLGADERATVAVRYTATPRRGLYFLAPDDVVRDRPVQVWSQCQDEDARHWIPCHDFPNLRWSTEMVVTAPAGWTVISNGRLVEHVPVEGGERWHWSQEEPHVTYLVTLVAGRFVELVADIDHLPVRYYVDPGREADGWRTFGRTPEMIRHFAGLTGAAYPWARYAQVAVHDFIFGGMENTTATTMSDRILIDERAAIDATADEIVAHELAHQWFGDLVTCRDWSHAWLNEGFATFFEQLDWELKGGRDAYLYSLKEQADLYFQEDDTRYRRPVVCNTYATPIDLFDRHLYEKGGWVLHMLRMHLGDRLFWAGVRRYLERHRGQVVETRDLLRALEEASGRSLEEFFDQWLYKGGFPELEVEVRHDADQGLLAVTVRQTQKADAVTPVFKLRLGLAVVAPGGAETLHALDVQEAQQTFSLKCAEAPCRVLVDPEGAILMRLNQKLARDLLIDALGHEPRAIGRWRAAQALARRDDRPALEALARAVREDAFWGVGAEAARALGEIRTHAAGEALAGLVDVEHPKVRRAVVRALGEFHTEAAARLLVERLQRGDASCLVEAELARAAGHTRQGLVYDALIAALDRPSWRDVIRVGAIDGLAALRDERAYVVVDAYADHGHPVGTRRAAVAALAELGEGRRVARERLEALLEGDDPYLTPEVLRALVKLRDPRAVTAVTRCQERAIDGRVRRTARETLRELEGLVPGEEYRRVRDGLDQVREDVRGLRDEIGRLRALVEKDAGPAPRAGGSRKTRKKAPRQPPVRGRQARSPRRG